MAVKLTKGFATLALKLQEQATSLSHSDIRARINDCLSDMSGNGSYCYLLDIFGDDESGDVVYSCDGDTMRAPYEIQTLSGKQACVIHSDQAEEVVPRTVYEPEVDEMDHMAGMTEAEKAIPADQRRMLGERFISKDERTAAKPGDFAGSGKSFPILKPEDVKAAVASIGRGVAGGQSAASLKSNIKRIAKSKGWDKHLPKAWQKDTAMATESALVETAASFLEDVPVLEAARTADYPVKLIQAGWGSSGYYPKEVLERDGPKIFTKGTQMFWNHPTAKEEAERPEGCMDNLAAVLTEDASWKENGKAGPGLYARAKVFADYAEKVAEKGPDTGLSIRAYGKAKEGKAEGRSGSIIENLTRAESVDFVTKPGAGGKVLTESAKAREQQEQEGAQVTDAEFKQLQESQRKLEADNRKLRERMALSDAATKGRTILSGLRLSEQVRERVLARCLTNVPLTEAGELDTEKFKVAIEAEAKDEAAYISSLTGGAKVIGMGSPVTEAAEPMTNEAIDAELVESFVGWGFDKDKADRLAKGRAA